MNIFKLEYEEFKKEVDKMLANITPEELLNELIKEGLEIEEEKVCKYCEEREKKSEINGTSFELKATAGFKNDRIYDSWIMKGKNDEKAGILIVTNGGNGVYFDINYCPICGRRLKK